MSIWDNQKELIQGLEHRRDRTYRLDKRVKIHQAYKAELSALEQKKLLNRVARGLGHILWAYL